MGSPGILDNEGSCRVRLSRTSGRGRSVLRTFSVLFVSLSLVAGCATPPDPTDPEAVAEFKQVNDPAEPVNRAIFAFNRGVDTVVLKPASGMYNHLVPPILREGVHNALDNLRSPVIFFNDILQGEFERAGDTFMRFLINSTIGVLGLGDPATDMGIAGHDEDFGQTLATWGTGEGPYVMLPVFGPSNPRDAVGLAVDFLVDPFNWWAANTNREYATYARGGTRAVDQRARNTDALEDLERTSLDFYATVRSLYRQRRANAITNGGDNSNLPAPGLTDVPSIPAIEDVQPRDEISQTK